MRPIKFRQPLWGHHSEFIGWHYWGFIDGRYIEPEFEPYSSVEEAAEQSQQFTGLNDKKGVEIKEKITGLLKSTKRSGIESLIKYLEDEGFFEAPASTRFHGCYPGGLAEHSFRVYELLRSYGKFNLDKVSSPGQQPLQITIDNIIIAALLHDVCKVGAYIGTEKPYKWNKQQPEGHALLSIERIKKYIELTELEELMIKYHMGVYGLYEFENDWQKGEYPLRGDDTKSKEERRGQSLANAWYHNPIVKVMYFCDELATLEEKASAIERGD